MLQNAFFVSDADESRLFDYGWQIAIRDPATAVRFVRGQKMRTVDRLFDEVAAACQFPFYFGENWAAFAECLGDQEWINSVRFVLIITRFEEVLAQEHREMGALGRSLKSAIGAYNRSKGNSESANSSFQLVVSGKVDHQQFLDPWLGELGNPRSLSV